MVNRTISIYEGVKHFFAFRESRKGHHADKPMSYPKNAPKYNDSRAIFTLFSIHFAFIVVISVSPMIPLEAEKLQNYFF